MYHLLWIFFIYAFLGWCTEVSYAALKTGRFVNRGFLNGPVCPVYGFGAVLILLLPPAVRQNPWLLFPCAALTATAFGAGFGNAIAGTVFVVAIITFFAFTTALVNVYYGEICMTVLGGKKFILPYRLLGCAFAIIGSVGALSVLWNLFDFFFGVCAVCNLVVCFLMRKQIGALINDYLTRLKSGKWEPTSEAAANAIPELWVNDKAAK